MILEAGMRISASQLREDENCPRLAWSGDCAAGDSVLSSYSASPVHLRPPCIVTSFLGRPLLEAILRY